MDCLSATHVNNINLQPMIASYNHVGPTDLFPTHAIKIRSYIQFDKIVWLFYFNNRLKCQLKHFSSSTLNLLEHYQ